MSTKFCWKKDISFRIDCLNRNYFGIYVAISRSRWISTGLALIGRLVYFNLKCTYWITTSLDKSCRIWSSITKSFEYLFQFQHRDCGFRRLSIHGKWKVPDMICMIIFIGTYVEGRTWIAYPCIEDRWFDLQTK